MLKSEISEIIHNEAYKNKLIGKNENPHLLDVLIRLMLYSNNNLKIKKLESNENIELRVENKLPNFYYDFYKLEINNNVYHIVIPSFYDDISDMNELLDWFIVNTIKKVNKEIWIFSGELHD